LLNQIKNSLIVSCQALEDEPLHSSFIMSKMALAAFQGGAAAIRANSKEDILAIKKEVPLPVIGIVKRNYPGSEVFITPTKKEMDELFAAKCDMIALDATLRKRPGGVSLADLVAYAREKAPEVKLMADVSGLEDALQAEQLGFDCISTTLYGYTKETSGKHIYDDDFSFLKLLLKEIRIPVIAEGNIITPEMAAKAISLGAHAVVVGGAITRPQLITQRFVNSIKNQMRAENDL